MIRVGTIALVALAGACSSSTDLPCRPLDLTEQWPSEEKAFFSALEDAGASVSLDWAREAMACEFGGYTLFVPISEPREVFVLQQRSGFEILRLSPTMLSVHEPSLLDVSLRDRNKDGHFDSTSMMTWKWQGDRFVHTRDWNLDGQPDTRSWERDDGSIREDAWVDGQWLEYDVAGGFVLASDPSKKLKVSESGGWRIVDTDQ